MSFCVCLQPAHIQSDPQPEQQLKAKGVNLSFDNVHKTPPVVCQQDITGMERKWVHVGSSSPFTNTPDWVNKGHMDSQEACLLKRRFSVSSSTAVLERLAEGQVKTNLLPEQINVDPDGRICLQHWN